MKDRIDLKAAILLLAILPLFFFFCNKGKLEKYKDEVRSVYSSQPEIRKNYAYSLLSEIKPEYTIEHSSKTQEDAIRFFLKEILSEKPESPSTVCNDEEIEKILMPNMLLSRYGMVYMSLEERKLHIGSRRLLGITRIRSIFKGKLFLPDSSDISFRIIAKPIQEHNAIRMIPIEEVHVLNKGKLVTVLGQIKSLLASKDQYKVCIVAP